MPIPADAQAGVAPPTIELICPTAWRDRIIAERAWAWRQWIPASRVTGLGGPPGAAKSTLAQMICTHKAIGIGYLGDSMLPGVAVYVTCEDDIDDLHYRQAQINAALGVDWSDLDHLHLESRLGKDSMLVVREAGLFRRTAYFDELSDTLGDLKADLLALDLAPDFWNGNEIDRQQVNEYVKTHLSFLCLRHGVAILLLYHPSVRGITSGTGDSGSTAWEGSFRSRLYIDRERNEKDQIVLDSQHRTLKRMKANYADTDEVPLIWREGYLHPTQPVEGDAVLAISKSKRQQEIDAAFLGCLDIATERALIVSPSPQSKATYFGNQFPVIWSEDKRRRQVSREQFEQAYQRLLVGQKVTVKRVGKGDRIATIARR